MAPAGEASEQGRAAVLIMNSNRGEVERLAHLLSDAGYETRGATCLDEFDIALQQPPGVALTLVDITGFDASLLEQCGRLGEAHIPFLILSPHRNIALPEECRRYTASGVLIKPIADSDLVEIMRSLIPRPVEG